MGRNHVQTNLHLSDAGAQEIPFDEAVQFFRGKVSLTKSEWNSIEEKLRFRSFTLAVMESHDTIERARQKLLGVFEKEGSLENFYKEVKAETASQMPFYWETVFRTNFQSAYNAGRRDQLLQEPPDAYELIVLEDGRTSDICRSLSGLVLAIDHPFWKTHWPPLHFNCRSTVRGVYKNQAEYKRLSSFANYSAQDFPVQDGFGFDPADNGTYWMLLPSLFERGLKNGAINTLNFQDGQLASFNEVWPLYKREKVKDSWIDVHQKARKESEFAENYTVAKIIAEQTGSNIKLLPVHNQHEWKSPDYLVDGVLWELESPSATKNAIDTAVREGQKQSSNLILHLPDNVDEELYRKAIFDRVRRTDSRTHAQNLLIIRNGQVERWTAEQIKDGWKK